MRIEEGGGGLVSERGMGVYGWGVYGGVRGGVYGWGRG